MTAGPSLTPWGRRSQRRARQAEADGALVGALSRAAVAVAGNEPAGPSPGAWHRLVRARAGDPRRPRRLLWAAVGAMTLASALAAVRFARVVRPAPLTFVVRGGALREGRRVEAGSRGTAVRFSDGTQIDLGANGRLAVDAADPHGARLRLQEGEAHFRVMHLPHAAWAVRAGPYLIEVTGTEFDVRWSESEQTAEVKMRSGSVRISGPLLSERVALGNGQHLLARLAAGDVRIDDGRAAAVPPPRAAPREASPVAAAPPSPARPSLPPPAGAVLGAAPASPAPAARDARVGAVPARSPRRLALSEPLARPQPPPGPTIAVPATEPPPLSPAPPRWSERPWAERVAAGDARAVVEDAESLGLDRALREAGGAELTALADAARYVGRSLLAERALATERRRFPGTVGARAAAFLLGRLADDRGDARAGLGWYRTYLAEAPEGPYASEALGRGMLIVARLEGREAALAVARDYLARFPNGTYLLQARALLEDR